MSKSFKRKCGNCAGFQKVNGFGGTRGICETFDGRAASGAGACNDWVGIKYKRVKKHNRKELINDRA